MKLKLPGKRFFHGLAFRHSIRLVMTSGLILLIPLMVFYVLLSIIVLQTSFSKTLGQHDYDVNYYRSCISHVKRIPEKLLSTLENSHLSDSMIILNIQSILYNDTGLYQNFIKGIRITLEPGVYSGSPGCFAIEGFIKDRKAEIRVLSGARDAFCEGDGYTLPKKLNKEVWGEPFHDSVGGKELRGTYSIPFWTIRECKKTFAGVLTLDLSMHFIDNCFQWDYADCLPEDDRRYNVLLSSDGFIIQASDSVLRNRKVERIKDDLKAKDLKSITARIKSGIVWINQPIDSSGSWDFLNIKPRNHFSICSKIGDPVPDWYFVSVYSANDPILYWYKIMLILVYGISLLILFPAFIYRIRKIATPIERLAEASRKLGERDFSVTFPKRKQKDEITQLTTNIAFMRDELNSYIENLRVTMAAKERIESEMKVAHMIQMGMLPREFTMPENWELFAMLDPARAVGGDLYDFFYLDADHLCIAIGDVAGKGVPGSLFMMVARTLLRSTAKLRLPVNEMIGDINRELCRENPNQMFVTFFAGIVNLRTGDMEFCNAGPNYPYILQPDGRLQQIRIRSGIPMGIFPDTTYTREYYTFNPQEVLILVTDGIAEAQNISDEFFGEDNLAATLISLTSKNARELTELLIIELKRFAEGAEQSDDITILSLRYEGRDRIM